MLMISGVAVIRMQDMAEQISRLTEAQQLYQDAVSLKERELSVRALLVSMRMRSLYLVLHPVHF